MSRHLTPAEREYRDSVESRIRDAISALNIGDFDMVDINLVLALEDVRNPPVKPSL